MHGSLHMIYATESDRSRRAASIRRPVTALVGRLASAHGIPPRAAPGTDSSLGHNRAAALRGR